MAATAREHGVLCNDYHDEPGHEPVDATYSAGLWEVADSRANAGQQPLRPTQMAGRSSTPVSASMSTFQPGSPARIPGRSQVVTSHQHFVGVQGPYWPSRYVREAGHAAHAVSLGLLAAVVQVDSGAAPSRRTAGRSGFLWRHKASAPPPEPPQQVLSWSGALTAAIRQKGDVIAAAAQQTAERSGRAVVDGARGVRQIVAAGVPRPAMDTAGRMAMFAGLAALLLVLVQIGSRILRNPQKRSRVCLSLLRNPLMPAAQHHNAVESCLVLPYHPRNVWLSCRSGMQMRRMPTQCRRSSFSRRAVS